MEREGGGEEGSFSPRGRKESCTDDRVHPRGEQGLEERVDREEAFNTCGIVSSIVDKNASTGLP